MEQMLRLLHDCGMPLDDVDFINSDGKTMNKLLLEVGFCAFTLVFCSLFFFFPNKIVSLVIFDNVYPCLYLGKTTDDSLHG